MSNLIVNNFVDNVDKNKKDGKIFTFTGEIQVEK